MLRTLIALALCLVTSLAHAQTSGRTGFIGAVPSIPPGATAIVRSTTSATDAAIYTVTAGKVFHLTSAAVAVSNTSGTAANCQVRVHSLTIAGDATNDRDIVGVWQNISGGNANEIGPVDIPVQGQCSTTTTRSCVFTRDCPAGETCTQGAVKAQGTGACAMSAQIVGWEAAP